MEYIIREDNQGLIMPNFEGTNLSDILKKDYGYLYQSMKANNCDVHFDVFNLFFELVHDKKVVGFAAYAITQPSSMTLTDTYVLPEFESENLLLKSFLLLMRSGSSVSILKPTRGTVEFLIKNNFATHLTDSIVTSAVSFDMLEEDIIGNFNMNGITPSTNLYDLNLCSPIFLYDISTPGVCEIFYLDVLASDDEKYNCRKFRDSINLDEYFNDIKKSFLENSDQFNQKLIDLKNSLPKSLFDYDEIIGEGDDLSDYFKGMVEDGMVDEKDAVRIRNQLKEEYENGEVTDQSLALRVSFLLSEDEHIGDMEKFEDINMQFDTFCPYCHNQVSPSNQYCLTCGYSIFEENMLTVEDIKKRG